MTFCVCLSSLGVVHSQGSGRWDFIPSHGQMMSIIGHAMSCLSVHQLIHIWVVHEHWCTYVWMPIKVDDGRNDV